MKIKQNEQKAGTLPPVATADTFYPLLHSKVRRLDLSAYSQRLCTEEESREFLSDTPCTRLRVRADGTPVSHRGGSFKEHDSFAKEAVGYKKLCKS